MLKPRVTIIVPCRNEEQHIEPLLRSILSQEEPLSGYEVILVDGRSEDGTLRKANNIAANDKRLIVLDNPQKIVSSAMNIGIRHANGEIIVRMDAHCEYPNDYVQCLIDLLESTSAANVGGVLVPTGTTRTQEAISAAYRTPISTGVALRGHPDDKKVREVDAVWGGCWWRNQLHEIGLFDETMVRNQDDELCFRLRKMGGENSSIFLHSDFLPCSGQFQAVIRSIYAIWLLEGQIDSQTPKAIAPAALYSCLVYNVSSVFFIWGAGLSSPYMGSCYKPDILCFGDSVIRVQRGSNIRMALVSRNFNILSRNACWIWLRVYSRSL